MTKSANRRQSTSAGFDKSQSERFIEAAREFGCDESEERFDETLKKVAKHKLPATAGQGTRGGRRGIR